MKLPLPLRRFGPRRISTLAAALVCLGATSTAVPEAQAPLQIVTTTYGAVSVADPYRYMEDPKDATYSAWRASALTETRAMLAALPARARVEAVDRLPAPERPSSIARAAHRLFYERPSKSHEGATEIVVRDLPSRIDRVIASDERYASPNVSASFGAFGVSPDGRRLAVHVYLGDARDSDIRILDVATGADEEPPLHHAVFDEIEFTPDGDRLIYASPALDASHGALIPDVVDQRVHELGSVQQQDPVIFGAGRSKLVDVPKGAFAFVDIPDTSRFAIAEVRDVGAGGSRFYAAPLASLARPNVPWRALGTPSDGYTDYAVHGDTIDLVRRRDAPNFCVVRASLNGPFRPRTIVAASDRVVISGTLDGIPKAGIFALNAASDADYIQLLDGGVSRMVRVPYAGNESQQDVVLPLTGTIREVATTQREPGALANVTSWADRGDVFAYDPTTRRATALEIVPPSSEPERAASELFAAAPDGTRIPVSLVRSATTAPGGRHPLLLTVIGAYGFSSTPDYERVPQAWLDLGGIYAVAHVRGGGEFGDAWHRAGMGASKPNSWHDVIAVAEMLVASGVADPRSIDLIGTTQSYLGGIAPGIAIGRAIEERPGLFAAAVLNAPAPDMLRAETTALGKESRSEFGTTVGAAEFDALREMSPYEHVTPGTHYPALLVRSFAAFGLGDDWEAAKFVARVRAASPDNAAYFDSAGAVPGDKRDRQAFAKEAYAFLLSQDDGAPPPP